jgi:Tol biopolymer transport system component
VTQITNGTCSDTTPEWSFDGSKIAFERQCGNDSNIYIANPDGSGVTQVTTTTLAFTPTWTPSGQIVYSNIVYQASPPNPVFCTNKYNVPCSDLRIINTDGTGDTELLASNWTNSSEVSLFNISAHVTPDGATVIFGCGPYDGGSWGGTGLQLCSIPLATGNVTQTPTLLSMATGAASSDPNIGLLKIGGQHQVVFSSIRPTISAGNVNVFSMNADGTGVTQLTRFVEPLEGQDAGWSPDMSMISFEQDTKGGAASIWVMNADGSNGHSTGIACNPNGCKPRFRP